MHIESLCWSLLLLLLGAAALARIVGWRECEGFVARAGVVVVLVLFCLPLAQHEARAVRDAALPHTPNLKPPEVVVVGAELLLGGALVVLGHAVLGVWWLRRRARQDDRVRIRHDLDAARRRSRSRLPPPTDEGTHS